MLRLPSLAHDRTTLALITIGLASAALVCFAISVWGAGIDNDVVDFMSATDSLFAGEGFVQSNGRPFTLWPPLPVLLFALGRVFGLEPATTGALIGCASMLIIVVTTASIVRRATNSGTAAILVAIGCGLSSALYASCVTALSEALFVALIVVAVRCAMEVLDTRHRGAFLAMTFATALACLQRYLGVTLLAALAAVLMIAPREDPWLARLKRCTLFCAAAALPLAIWLVRNVIVVGSLTGPRPGVGAELLSIASKSELVLQTWFVGAWPHVPGAVALTMFALVIASTFAPAARGRRCTAGFVLFAFPLCYFLLSTWMNHRVRIDGIADRQMIPLAPFAWIALGVGVHAAITSLSALSLRRAAMGLVVLMFASHAIVAASELSRRVSRWRLEGVDFYITRAWSQSTLVDWVREHPLEGVIFSNDPHAVYLWSKRRARQLPVRPAGFSAFADRVDQKPDFIVWFRRNPREVLPVDVLSKRLELSSIVESEFGAVYAVEAR